MDEALVLDEHFAGVSGEDVLKLRLRRLRRYLEAKQSLFCNGGVLCSSSTVQLGSGISRVAFLGGSRLTVRMVFF